MKVKDFFGLFLESTPLYMTFVISLFISVTVIYFFIPKFPRIVYSFDAEKFKKDLILRASLSGKDPSVVSEIAKDLRRNLDALALRDKTFVINRRALLSNGFTELKVVDVTKEMEDKLFDKYLPLNAGAFKNFLRGSVNGTNRNQ